jgi:hypothetical protein
MRDHAAVQLGNALFPQCMSPLLAQTHRPSTSSAGAAPCSLFEVIDRDPLRTASVTINSSTKLGQRDDG